MPAVSLSRIGGALAIGWAATLTPPMAAQGLDGVWRSDGYGDVFEIRGRIQQLYEVTQSTCVRTWQAVQDTARRPGAEAVFRRASEVLAIHPNGEPASRRLQSDFTVSYIVIRRIPQRPAVCSHPVPNTPAGNFEVFTRTWAENYLFLEQRPVDWPAVVAAARARVTSRTTPRELFDILSEMIRPLEDAHTSLIAHALKETFFGYRKEADRFLRGGLDHYLKVQIPRLTGITNRYLRPPIRKWCNDQVQFAWLADSVGYLQLLSFTGYTKDNTFASGLPALEAALDTIFGDAGRVRALVIDVRVNIGGADPYVIAVVSRLATSEYLAYSKQARADPADRTKWTPLQPRLVHPSARPGFHGRVVELIGPLTFSGGETFTQALMGRSPKVVRIGENTQGVFADVLERDLPNGWHFGLPNEVYRTADGKTFDVTGIPPDVAVPVYPEDEVAAGRDGALEKALEVLGVTRVRAP